MRTNKTTHTLRDLISKYFETCILNQITMEISNMGKICGLCDPLQKHTSDTQSNYAKLNSKFRTI